MNFLLPLKAGGIIMVSEGKNCKILKKGI